MISLKVKVNSLIKFYVKGYKLNSNLYQNMYKMRIMKNIFLTNIKR